MMKSGALAVRPQTSMVPAPANMSAITPVSGAKMASTKDRAVKRI